MDRKLYRAPAWPGLEAPAPVYVPADPTTAAEVTQALGREGSVLALANAGGVRAFRLDAADGTRWFIKLVSERRWPELQAAERIAQWLSAAGAPVVAALDLDPPKSRGGDRFACYPFHDGGPPAADAATARKLGGALAALHRGLAAHPDRGQWRLATEERLLRLTETRRELARGRAAGPEPDRLRAIAADPAVSFVPSERPALGASQPSHGDLNLFNILVSAEQVAFLDFEDVVHSTLPPVFDVALLCQRTILVREGDAAAARDLVTMLTGAYTAAGGIAVDPRWLPGVLQGLSLRSLCTLALVDPDGTDPDEWRKFFHLYDAAGVMA